MSEEEDYRTNKSNSSSSEEENDTKNNSDDSNSENDSDEDSDSSKNKRKKVPENLRDPKDIYADFVKVLHKNLPVGNQDYNDDALLEKLVSNMQTEVAKMETLGHEYRYNQSPLNDPENMQLLTISSKVCEEDNYQALTHCGLVKACFSVIRTATVLTGFVKGCLELVSVITLYDNDTSDILCNDTEESFQLLNKVCYFFEISNEEGKPIILKIFYNILSSEVCEEFSFDVIFPKFCSVLTYSDVNLLMQGLHGIEISMQKEKYDECKIQSRLVRRNVAPLLATLLTHYSDEVVLKTVSVILKLYDNCLNEYETDFYKTAIVRTGLPIHLLSLLMNRTDNQDIVLSVWHLLERIAGNQQPAQFFFDFGYVNILLDFLQCYSCDTAGKALGVLTDLFESCSANHRRILMKNENFLRSLVDILNENKMKKVLKNFSAIYLEPALRIYTTLCECLHDVKGSVDREKSPLYYGDYGYSEESSDSEDETPKDILLIGEIKSVLNFLMKLDFHGKLICLKNNKEIGSMYIVCRIDDLFQSAVSKHLEIDLSDRTRYN